MDNVYDNIAFNDSAVPQSFSGSSAVDGSSVDTQGFNSAVIKASGAAASGSPSAATLAVKLQESSDNSTWSDALDTTGTVIGFTLTVTSAAASNLARIEALGTTRKRYLRAVITPAFTGGTSPAALGLAEIVLGNAFSLPANTTPSNT